MGNQTVETLFNVDNTPLVEETPLNILQGITLANKSVGDATSINSTFGLIMQDELIEERVTRDLTSAPDFQATEEDEKFIGSNE